MKKYNLKRVSLALFLSASSALFSQNIAINSSGNNSNPAAILDLSGNPNLGFLMPTVTLTNSASASPISSPPAGLIVYNSSTSTANGLSGAGFYYWSGTAWLYLINSGSTLSGDTGISSYLARWVSPTTLGTGVMQDNGTGVGISASPITPKNLLDVNGGVAVGSYAGNNAAPANAAIVSGNVGIGTSSPNAAAALDISSSTKGVLIPRLASNPSSTATGLMYYNTTTNCFVFWTGTAWQNMFCTCSGPPSAPGTINGATSYCSNATGVTYSTSSVTGATYYTWSVPTGAAITAGQGTTGITVNFGTASGNVSVVANNSCATSAASVLPVTAEALPAVSGQPGSTSVCSTGGTATFTVSATGGSLTYQWQVNSGSGWSALSNGSYYSNVTTSTLSITNPILAMSGYQYECVVSGTCSPSATSNAATLTVTPIPTISGNPSAANLCSDGGIATFTVSATGSSLTYQWQVNTGSSWNNVSNGGVYSGATSSILTVTNPTSSYNGYQYECIVSSGPCNPGPTSNPATLTITSLPTITGQPTSSSQLCSTGGSATFTVSATGNAALTYQWEVNNGSGFTTVSNGGIYSGATTTTLTVTNPTTSQNGYQYECQVNSGPCNPGTTSNAATLNVGTFTLQPTSEGICTAGGTVNFTAGAIGSGLSYQWQVNSGSGWTTLSNAGYYSGVTTNTLTVTNPTTAMNGYEYDCVVTGTCPNDTSNAVPLTVANIPSVPITITNTQTTATPNNFVQMITVNSSEFSAYESSGLQNVLFSTGGLGTGTPLYAWIERGASSDSTTTVYWVNLGTSIPASSTYTIYMTFMPSTVMTSTTSYTGVAPQLFGGSYYATTYGEYDNGSKVFPAYFNGNTTVSGNFTYGSNAGEMQATTDASFVSGQTVNVINFTPNNASGGDAAYIYSAQALPVTTGVGYIGESSLRIAGDPNTAIGVLGFFDGTSGTPKNGISVGTGYFGAYFFESWDVNNGNSDGDNSGSGGAPETPVYASILWTGTSASSFYGYLAPQLYSTTGGYSATQGTNPLTAATDLYLGIHVTSSGNSGDVNTNWMRARAMPPNYTSTNNTMPTVSIGGGVAITGQPSSTSQLCSSGATATFTVSATGNGLTYQWQVNSGSGFTNVSNAGIYSGVTTPTLTVTNPTDSQNGYQYNCVVTGAVCDPGDAISNAATLNVGTFTLQPTNAAVGSSGGTATFTVGAIGSGLTYQWMVDSTSGWGALSNNSFYSGVTTATLTVTNPTTSMSGFLYKCLVTGTCPNDTSNAATLVVGIPSVPLTITNSQTTATPNNFVQMITVHNSTYSTYENSGLQNVEFSTGAGGTGAILYAWIESGASNSSDSTIYWVNLANSIPASSTYTIYMNFLPSTVMTSTTSYTGVAPQLFGTGYYATSYGEYDNGAKVFTAYFNGNTPTSSFNYSTSAEGNLTSTTDASFEGTANFPASSPINVLNFYQNHGSGGDAAYVYNATSIPVSAVGGYVGESSYRLPANQTVGIGEVGFFNGSSDAPSDGLSVGMGNSGCYFYFTYINSGSSSGSSLYATSADVLTPCYGNIIWPGKTTSSTTVYGYNAPQLYSVSGVPSGANAVETTTNNYLSGASVLYMGIHVQATNNDGNININWMRARPNPPNNTSTLTGNGGNTMPAVSFGVLIP